MNKKFAYLLLILCICAVSVAGEIKQFERQVNITMDNNSVKIRADGLEDNFECGSYYNESWTTRFSTNVTCQENYFADLVDTKFNEIRNKIDNVSTDIGTYQSEADSYYDLYSECHGNLSSCVTWKEQNQGYKAKFDNKDDEWNLRGREIDRLNNNLFMMNKTKSDVELDKNDLTGQRNLFAFLTFIFGVATITMYIRYVKRVEKKKESPTEQDDNRSMDGLL